MRDKAGAGCRFEAELIKARKDEPEKDKKVKLIIKRGDEIVKIELIRKDLATSQVKLNSAQEEYMRARAEKIASGDSLITITADGLQAELEAFMWKILEKIQK